MDINEVELFDELRNFSEIIENGTSPLHFLQKKKISNSVGDIYANVAIAELYLHYQ